MKEVLKHIHIKGTLATDCYPENHPRTFEFECLENFLDYLAKLGIDTGSDLRRRVVELEDKLEALTESYNEHTHSIHDGDDRYQGATGDVGSLFKVRDT